MTIIPLGTNGFFPSFGRQIACYVIPLKNKLIILDAGSGLFRLAEPIGKKLLSNVSDIHLFLSHYHLDHTFGFYAAFKIFKNKKVTVYAQETKQVFRELVTLKYFPVDYIKEHNNFNWKSLKIGENTLDGYQILVRKQHHRGEGSLAFRFRLQNKELAYITDSEPNQNCIDFAREVDLLLMEHYLTGDKIKSNRIEDQSEGGHISTIGAARIAKLAQVGKLALIHHYPFYNNKNLISQLKISRSIFPNTELAQDLKEIDF